MGFGREVGEVGEVGGHLCVLQTRCCRNGQSLPSCSSDDDAAAAAVALLLLLLLLLLWLWLSWEGESLEMGRI